MSKARNWNSNQSESTSVKNPTIEQLRGLFPVAELSEAHLKTATRLAELAVVPEGSVVANEALLQSHYVYLLSGLVASKSGAYSEQDIGLGLSLDTVLGSGNIIYAEEDCNVVLIEKNQLDSMLCWDQVAKSLLVELTAERDRDEDREWLSTLLLSNLFHRLPPFNIRLVVDKFVSRVVSADEMIIREGENGDECYLIKEGEAVVSVYDEQLGCEKELARLSAGQCFGEDALVNKARRNASVRMQQNGVLMVLKKRDFLSLMTEPAIFSVPAAQAMPLVLANDAGWLDVRSQQEFDFDALDGAFHVPIHLISLKSRMLDKERKYFAYCSTGRRAMAAAYLLQQNGFNVIPVREGLESIHRD